MTGVGLGTFLRPGHGEPVKLAVHATLGAAAAACLAYNVAAFAARRERHLARNAAIYGAILALEVAHVRHHRAADAPAWPDARLA